MIETLTAAAIAQLAFDGVIQAGAGKLTEAGLEKGKQLWQKIRGKVKEEGVAEAALVEVEKNKSQEILEQQVIPRLHEAMLKDPQFAHEVQHIAQQINQEIEVGSQDNIPVTAASHGHSKQYNIVKPSAETQTFGDTYIENIEKK